MSDIASLNDHINQLFLLYTWQIIIESIIRGLIALYVFITVLVFRKRREAFLWLIPLALVINNVMNTSLAIGAVMHGYKPVDYFAIETTTRRVILYIGNASFVIAHWIFSAQYL